MTSSSCQDSMVAWGITLNQHVWPILAPGVLCWDQLDNKLRFQNCALPGSSHRQGLTLSLPVPANSGPRLHLWNPPLRARLQPGLKCTVQLPSSCQMAPYQWLCGPYRTQTILTLALGQFLDDNITWDTLRWEATPFTVSHFSTQGTESFSFSYLWPKN